MINIIYLCTRQKNHPQPISMGSYCYKIHSTTSPQSSQLQQLSKENSELVKLERLAEQGNAEAQYKLGLKYDMGVEVDQDYKKAFELYEKSAQQGLASSQSKLGSMYRYGKGVEVNHARATEWYWKLTISLARYIYIKQKET